MGEIRWESIEILFIWRLISFLLKGWRWGSFFMKWFIRMEGSICKFGGRKKKLVLMKWGVLLIIRVRKYVIFKILIINFKSLLNVFRKMKGLFIMENLFLRLKIKSV